MRILRPRRWFSEILISNTDVTTMSDGTDCYALVKAAGRYREYPRTEGISTTVAITLTLQDLVTRILSLTTTSVIEKPLEANSFSSSFETLLDLFSPKLTPKADDIVVYVDGSWDLFHAEHIKLLKTAKAFGSFLVVGVFSESEAKAVNDEVLICNSKRE